MKSVGKARNNGLYRHIRTSKEIIRNLLNDSYKKVRKVTNMRREYINACYPYICQSGKQQVIEITEKLMNY